MAKLSLKGKTLPGMMGGPGSVPMPMARPMMGGMMGNPPTVPKPKLKRPPVMKRKGVALSKFGPAKVVAKKFKQTKMPMI